ncbi:hypothetical protein BT93_J0341 [Corymbia citriodora subsp. variegata]|nr:hypothetical protein BT93_J0341 [Corymbia citriodora subsp. variegata]
MAATVHNPLFSNLAALKSTQPAHGSAAARAGTRRVGSGSGVRCYQGQASELESQRVTLKNGGDALDICRVLNGMWQTGGGWGRIDRDDAVDAMLRHADAGLTTFDMADHCM